MSKFPLEVTKNGKTEKVTFAVDLKEWLDAGWKEKGAEPENKPSQFDSLNKDQLIQLATSKGLLVNANMNKAELIASIEATVAK
jgi:hypothetical protein